MIFEYNNSEKKNGIYRITNLSNGRIYIGSAKPFKRRWNRHCNALNQGRHKNHYLQADFNKCGSDVFVFNVLEVVEGTKEERLAREQIYLDLYHDDCQQCYNMCKIAGSTEGYRHSPESKALIAAASKGHNTSAEHRAKISAGNKGKRRRPSVETKAKMSKSRKEYLQIFKALDNSSACIQENKSDFLVISAT